jgi:hypothetical protein
MSYNIYKGYKFKTFNYKKKIKNEIKFYLLLKNNKYYIYI